MNELEFIGTVLVSGNRCLCCGVAGDNDDDDDT